MNDENNIPVLHDALLAIQAAGRIAVEAGCGTIGDVTLFYAIWLRNSGLVRSLFGPWVESWPGTLVSAAKWF